MKLSKLNTASCLLWPSRVYLCDANVLLMQFSCEQIKEKNSRLFQRKEKIPIKRHSKLGLKENFLKPHKEYLLNQQQTPSNDESSEPLNEEQDQITKLFMSAVNTDGSTRKDKQRYKDGKEIIKNCIIHR